VTTLGGCVIATDDNGGGIFVGSSRTVSYRCDDDRRMTVRYSDNLRRASVDTGRDTYRLTLADRDSGGRIYDGEADGDDLTLSVDGDRAEFSIEDGGKWDDCRARD
jgi:hypothetical protein